MYALAAGGFLLSIPFGRQQLMRNEMTRMHTAAVILQKYFRMWLAQARLIRLQLDAIGKSSDMERIVFPEQSDQVGRRLLRIGHRVAWPQQYATELAISVVSVGSER